MKTRQTIVCGTRNLFRAFAYATFALTLATLSLTGCDNGTGGGNTTTINTYTAIANNNVSTTAILFTFKEEVFVSWDDFNETSITITDDTGSVTKGNITYPSNGLTKNVTLGVTVNTAGNVTVSINYPGFSNSAMTIYPVESGSKTVAVYKP